MELLFMSISGAVLIAVVAGVRAVFGSRIPKRVMEVFWLIVLLRLFFPFSFWPDQGTAERVLAQAVSPLWKQQEENFVFWMIWLTGMLVLALYFIYVNRKFYRGISDVRRPEDGFLAQWTKQLGKRRISVKLSESVSTPMACGFFRPVILLPAAMDFSDRQQLEFVLAHEWQHIRRRDWLKKLLLTIALCVHWFNPAVWLLYSLANRDIELACDEAVLRALGEEDGEQYALALIRLQAQRKRFMPLASGFGAQAAKERIRSIMGFGKAGSKAALVSSCMAVALSLTLIIGQPWMAARGGAGFFPHSPQQAVWNGTDGQVHTGDGFFDNITKNGSAIAFMGFRVADDVVTFQVRSELEDGEYGITVIDDTHEVIYTGWFDSEREVLDTLQSLAQSRGAQGG